MQVDMRKNEYKIKLLVLWDILCRFTDEEHPMNTDEIIEKLNEKGIASSRKVLVADIALLNENGYEVLSFKKKFHYYYVANRPFDTAEIVLLSDVIKASKLTASQKNNIIDKLSGTLCSYQAMLISKNIVSFDKGKFGNSSFIYSVDGIERAINDNKQISFKYFNYDEKHNKVYRRKLLHTHGQSDIVGRQFPVVGVRLLYRRAKAKQTLSYSGLRRIAFRQKDIG